MDKCRHLLSESKTPPGVPVRALVIEKRVQNLNRLTTYPAIRIKKCRENPPRGLVELNAAGAQWAIPTGIERGISALGRIPVSVKTETDGSKNSISLLYSLQFLGSLPLPRLAASAAVAR